MKNISRLIMILALILPVSISSCNPQDDLYDNPNCHDCGQEESDNSVGVLDEGALYSEGEFLTGKVTGSPSSMVDIIVHLDNGGILSCSTSMGLWGDYFRNLDYQTYYLAVVVEIRNVDRQVDNVTGQVTFKYFAKVSSPEVYAIP